MHNPCDILVEENDPLERVDVEVINILKKNDSLDILEKFQSSGTRYHTLKIGNRIIGVIFAEECPSIDLMEKCDTLVGNPDKMIAMVENKKLFHIQRMIIDEPYRKRGYCGVFLKILSRIYHYIDWTIEFKENTSIDQVCKLLRQYEKIQPFMTYDDKIVWHIQRIAN